MLATSKNKVRLTTVCAILAIASAGFGLCMGPFGFDIAGIAFRSSRVALAALTGAALAGTGCALQALFRNPLADPFIIGVSGGAALFGALGIAIFSYTIFLPAFSIGGALLAILLLALVLRKASGFGQHTALLWGVAINAFASSAVTLIKIMLPAQKTQAMLFWLVGSIGYPSWGSLALVALTTLVGCAILLKHSGQLNVLMLGDEEAARLGIDANKVKTAVFLASSFMIGVLVSYTGMIGFVGLLVPHALRQIIGNDQRLLLPASLLVGAAVLTGFDGMSRGLFSVLHSELPVGALTALVGAPIFGWLLLSKGATEVGCANPVLDTGAAHRHEALRPNAVRRGPVGPWQHPTTLQASSLQIKAGEKTLFQNLNLTIRSGEITLLIGENGVGKSTLLNHLAGIHEAKEGTVELNNQNLAILDSNKRAQLIASVGQLEDITANMLVEERIAQGLIPHRGHGAPIDQRTLQKIQHLCVELNIVHLLGRNLQTLSGGERKRVQIARALINDKAQAYILDEPFAGLDLRQHKIVLNAFKERAQMGRIVLFSAHEVWSLAPMVDRIIELGSDGIKKRPGEITRAQTYHREENTMNG